MAAQEADQALVEAALLGDREALAQLVRSHWGRVFGYLVRLSGDYYLAQDLTQETFFRAWQGLAGLRRSTPFATWLYRIAHNAFVDHVRSWPSRHVLLTGDPAGGDPDGETLAGGSWRGMGEPVGGGPDPVVSLVDRRLERSRATALLARLSPEHRAVVVLRFYEELSLAEIAATLDLPVGTVKSRLHYAFRELRRAMEADRLRAGQQAETERRSGSKGRRGGSRGQEVGGGD